MSLADTKRLSAEFAYLLEQKSSLVEPEVITRDTPLIQVRINELFIATTDDTNTDQRWKVTGLGPLKDLEKTFLTSRSVAPAYTDQEVFNVKVIVPPLAKRIADYCVKNLEPKQFFALKNHLGGFNTN
ncbi:MAG: hypothetical protein K9G62_08255 [Alphaproteobacteria bacterium]|nr:hypothetical protein [Alphaproteobacteria bacterium]